MDKLTASEAIYGFCAWLTTRDKVVEMGAAKDCGNIANLIAIFCNENGLVDPRENYHEFLILPKE